MIIRKQILNLTKEEIEEITDILSSEKVANKVIEYEIDVLTNEEKEYLTHLLHFYKNSIEGFNITGIRKTLTGAYEYLTFFYTLTIMNKNPEYSITSFVFPTHAMFKGMTSGCLYTLKELDIE